MPIVNTVNGPIEAEQLGITAIHEHLLLGMPGWEHMAGLVFDRARAFEKIKKDLLEFKRLGGQTLVDCTGMAMGRNVEFAQALSRSSGVHIVCCTGFREERTIPGHYSPFWGRTHEYLARIFIGEITQGMSVPYMRRTDSLAGAIKVGNSEGQITEMEEMAYRAAAQAGRRTGVVVITHGSSMARRQLQLLLEEGLSPEQVIISHCDDNPDLERDRGLARAGAYVGYDRAGSDGTGDQRRAELVKAMVDAGLTERVFISCDTIGYALGGEQPQRGYAHLLANFVPLLRRVGVSEQALHTILVENPKRVLGLARN